MEERWIKAQYIYSNGNIIDFTGLYEVSNMGNVKSIGRTEEGHNKAYYRKERILTPSKKRRYYSVSLSKDGVIYCCTVHRLVLSSFSPSFDNCGVIDHIDGNTHNNNLSNLKWCNNQKENINNINSLKRKFKTILQFDLEGNLINEYNSATELSKLKNYKRSYIYDCCNGRYKQAYGYVWKYKKKAV